MKVPVLAREPIRSSEKKIADYGLFLILTAGFLIRAVGISFGLPFLYHADEPALINHAMAHGTGDLNPHYFKLPPFLGYCLFLVYGSYFLVGFLLGHFPSPEAFAGKFVADPTSFYLIGRVVLGLLPGTLTIYLIYRLTKDIFSRNLALLSALLLSFAFLHVRDSHYAVYDIPLTMGLCAAFLFLVRLVRDGRTRDYVFFGVAAGFTTAAKYNGALILVPFVLALAGRRGRKRPPGWVQAFDRRFWVGLTTAFFCYLVGNPFSVIDFGTFWNDLTIQAGTESPIGWLHHITYSLTEGVGVPILGTGFLGLLICLSDPDLRRKLVAAFIVLWLLVMGLFSQMYERYALPIVPFLCLSASVGIFWIAGWFPERWRRLAVVALSIASLWTPAARSIVTDYLFLEEDTRTIAKRWVESEIPSGSAIALDTPFHLPRLRFEEGQLRGKFEQIRGPLGKFNELRLNLLLSAGKREPRSYQLYFLEDEPGAGERPLFASPTLPFDTEALKKAGVEYVLVTRLTKNYEHPDFYRKLEQEGQLMKEFSPYRNPEVRFGLSTVRQTAAATEGRDLVSRDRFGDIIQVFKLTVD